MKGKVTYLGISRVGLMFGKIMDENNQEHYFDSRVLNGLTMNDFQTGTPVIFAMHGTTVTAVKKAESTADFIDDERTQQKQKDFFRHILGWSIEATEEDPHLFCIPEEVDKIKTGAISYVIGRKGTGKSAIVKNIAAADPDNMKKINLSFKDFPFNLLYACEDNDYGQPNQYISIWQYIIYHRVGSMILKYEKLDKNCENRLKALLVPTDEKIKKVLGKINEFSVGLSFLGTGINLGIGQKEAELSWLEQLQMLKELIKELNVTSQYFVLFDELDEDYKNFASVKERDSYISMLTSLFKAVQHVRRNLGHLYGKIVPVVFLRTDIYNQITDSDKNKWREHLIELEWNTDKIKKIFAYRIHNSYYEYGEREDPAILNFDMEFQRIFPEPYVNYGNKQGKQLSTFAYITRSTQLRPRDYIQYVKICVQFAVERNLTYVSSQIVKEADDKFSEYLKQEIIDEIFPVVPQINDVLAILSVIRKQTFNPSLFIEEYQNEVRKGNLEDKGAENILKILFDYNIVGNQPSMRDQMVFKYIHKDAKFNFKENILIHRGLYKALQVF